MGSFGGVLGGFAKGFEGGYALGLRRREQDLSEYRYGRPPDDEVNAQDTGTGGGGSLPATQPGTDSGTTSSTGGGTMPNAGGKAVGQQFYDYFRSKGLSHAAAAGIAGNLMQESGGDPRVIGGHRRGDNGKSAFVAQWQGQRLTNLHKFAGTQTPTLQQQLDFVLEEMKPDSPYRDDIAASNGAAILGAKTVADAASLFRSKFERPSADDLGSRLKYANSFADSGGTAAPASGTAAAGVTDAVKEQGGDPDSPLTDSLTDLKKKDEEEDDIETAEAIPIPEAPVQKVAGWQDFAQPVWEEEDTMFAAEGGVIPDKYNAARSFTQVPQPAADAAAAPKPSSSWTPRRVGQASATPTMSTGPTASQLKFRELRATPVQQPVAAAAPVAAAQPYQVTDAVRQLARAKAQQPSSKGHELRQQREIARLQQIVDQERAAAAAGTPMRFAKGGKVAARQPKRFSEGVRRERTMSTRGDEAGQSARDRAARRVTGGSSTALDPDGYWTKPTKPRSHDTPRSRRSKDGTDATTTSSTAAPVPSPDDGAIPDDLAVSPWRPDNAPSTNAPTNQTLLRKPAGTPALSEHELGSVAPRGVPRSRTGQPMPDMDAGTSPRPGRGALPTSPKDTTPQQPRPEGGAGRRTGAVPIAPESNRMYSTAAPYAPIVGQQAIEGAVPEPELQVEPGAWINGQFIPQSALEPRVAFAEGGVIPEDPLESDRADAAAYQQPQRPQQEMQRPEPEDRQPTPKLLQDVGAAIKGGLGFLTRTFGLDGGGGAIRTPESSGDIQGGARRLALGEGAASTEEINAIDDKIDPERRMSEGDRHMERMAKTMQWYLMNGRKEDAEGAAASLVQYGSRKFSQLGSMAGAAYKEYQKTGNPAALEDAVGYLEKAYEFIPDGGSFDVISVDPETGKLMTVKRNADGSEENIEINPDQLPALLQQVQSGSSYWKEIQRLADPEGARQKDRQTHEKSEWDRRHGIERTEELTDEEREAKRKAETEAGNRKYEESEHDRRARLAQDIATESKLRDEALLRSRPKTKTGEDIVLEDYKTEYYDYWKAFNAYNADGGDTPENKAALDTAGSKLFEAVDGDAKALKDLGVEIGEAGFTPQAPTGGTEAAPEGLPAGAKKAPDGNYYVPKPGGGWQKVVPKAAAPVG